MKRFWSLVLTAAAVLAIGQVSLAEDAGKAADKAAAKADKAADKAAAKAEKALKAPRAAADGPQYAGLNLTDDQKLKINETAVHKKAALEEWDKKHEAHMAELSEARKSGDKAKSGPAAKELGTLKSEREALDNQYDDAIQGVLTEDQKKAYQGNRVYAAMMQKYGKAGVTDAQKAEIRTRSNKLGGTLVGKDAAAAKEAMVGLQGSIEAEVLTAEQREAMKQKPKEKAAKAAEPAPTTPAAPK